MYNKLDFFINCNRLKLQYLRENQQNTAANNNRYHRMLIQQATFKHSPLHLMSITKYLCFFSILNVQFYDHKCYVMFTYSQ
ncbi:hypothetical protein T05_14265 [Trichinella murrelli]|uniref:Uncharacterized protein n=1 Tax=Trichinella murrelli TaxID=144512 RepID=A0A0V0U8Q4_9BILA|nr:hypothetical protein T05_14265 [Trichinella murrelli]